MSFRVHGVTAVMVAQGLFAAAKIFDVPPLSVYATHKPGARKARSCCAAALISVLPKGRKVGGSAAVARLVGVTGPDVSPGTLRRQGITTDHLLTVVEAMKTAGLDVASLWVEAETAPSVDGASDGLPKPLQAPKPPRAPRPPRAAKSAVAKAARPAPTPTALPAPTPAAETAAPVVHVLPMKANLRRWTRQFLTAGWTPREVAKLFDLHPAQVKAETLELQHG